jgi:hypothetical protein
MANYDVHIEPGDYFSRNELKSRLLQMGIECDTYQDKNFYVKLYNEAIKSEAARLKILDRLKKDTEFYQERQNLKTRPRDKSEEPVLLPQKVAKMEKEEPTGTNKAAMKEMISKNYKLLESNKKLTMDTIVPDKSAVVIPKEDLPKEPRLSDPVRKGDKSFTDLKGRPFAPVVATAKLNSDNNIRMVSNKDLGKLVIEDNKLPLNPIPESSGYNRNPLLFPNKDIYNESLFRRSEENKKVFDTSINEEDTRKPIQEQKKVEAFVIRDSRNNLQQFDELVPRKDKSVQDLNDLGRNIKPSFKKLTTMTSNNNLNNTFMPPSRLISDNSVNGANPINTTGTDSSLLVNNVKRQKDISLKDFLEIRQNQNGSKINLLSQYLVAGCAATVMFFGLKYCIENNPEVLNVPIEYIQRLFTSTQSTVTETITNNVGPMPQIPIVTKVQDSLSFWSSFFKFLSNPLQSTWDLVLNFVWGKIYWFLLGLLGKVVFWYAYREYRYRSNAKKIFNSLKYDLKRLVDDNEPQHGLSEDFIINKYSSEYSYSENEFRNKIFPLMKKMRIADGYIREFESYNNGKRKILWQYNGY